MVQVKLAKSKPRVLRRKNIKKKTGAKAQAKQIQALSTQLNSLTKRNFAKCATRWQRNNLTVDTVSGSGYAYVCPLPYVPGNPAGSGTGNPPSTFTDNLALAAQPSYSKEMIFGLPADAQNSNMVYHTGGTIKWQMISTEPSFSKYTLALIRPKKHMADQLVKDRLLKQGSGTVATPGFASLLNYGLDYTSHTGAGSTTALGTFFGATINRKYWDVIQQKELTFSHPNATALTTNVNPANTKPSNNAITARGTWKIPAGGICKNAALTTQSGIRPEATGWEVEYGDQTNEFGCYLICINNGASIEPNETVLLSFNVIDYYKAAV